MRTLNFVKKNGQVTWSEALDFVLSLLHDGNYDVIIKRHQEPRSISQNALMWMWFECMAQETGSERMDIHDYYAFKFLARRVRVGNCEFWKPGRTSELTKDAFTLFLNKVKADAATDFGIILPLPEDRYFEQFRQQYKQYTQNQ